MHRLCRNFALPCLLAAALACGAAERPGEETTARTGGTDPGDEVEAVEAVREQYVAALNAEDLQRLAGFWTEDVALMPPSQPVVEGTTAASGLYTAMFRQFDVQIVVTSEESGAAGDWAFDRGSYTLNLTSRAAPESATGRPPQTGAPAATSAILAEDGKYVVLLRRDAGGGWKVARHIWNTDAPAPGGSGAAGADQAGGAGAPR
ncbi:MAG TPA: nuclear transport factor 2 family protein [Thermoanaerobaculia bacterium]|nr:nuclear transport factor 2 family protein [Thermoanaerobaculia bacterium]